MILNEFRIDLLTDALAHHRKLVEEPVSPEVVAALGMKKEEIEAHLKHGLEEIDRMLEELAVCRRSVKC